MSFSPLNISLAGGLLILSGLFSGLNLGLMSFAEDDLRVIIEGNDNAREVACAKRILPLRKRGNLLLCTLLLGNTLVNALIAVLLTSMTSGLYASLLTTMLIVLFGEIGPQSVCSRYALEIGSFAVPIVWCFVVITFVIAWPISLLLDRVLGREISAVYTKSEFLSLIRLNVDDEDHRQQSGLTVEDGKILKGALTFRHCAVEQIMTPIDACVMLPKSSTVDLETVQSLLARGHSRVPVYDDDKSNVRGPKGAGPKANVCALLYLKDLVGIGYEKGVALAEVLACFDSSGRVHRIKSTALVGEAYDLCKATRVKMCIVVNGDEQDMTTPSPAVGVITLEDIIEEIIQDEIVDDDDVLEDAAAVSLRRRQAPSYNERRYDPSLFVKISSDHGSGSGRKKSPSGNRTRYVGVLTNFGGWDICHILLM